MGSPAGDELDLPAFLPSLVPSIIVQACTGRGKDEKHSTDVFSEPHGQDFNSNGEVKKTLRVPGLVQGVGVVAILDLSGYTALSELLFKGSDNAGGERLFKTINPFFGALIDTIHEYRGDIIKFCGDSIIVAWTQPDVENEQPGVKMPHLKFEFIQNALFCVGEVLRKYDGYHVQLPNQDISGSASSLYMSSKVGTQDNYQMGVHIGIGFGALTHIFVGEKKRGRSEYLVIGKAITDASSMLAKTRRGQVAMAARGWEAFVTRSDYADYTHEDAKFITKGDNVLGSHHSRLSELRRVTTVFLQIHEFSPSMPALDAMYLIQRLFDTLKTPLENYKGRL
ncbi:Adenylate cyclase type 10, partial [Dinochytrium kinnereticum]